MPEGVIERVEGICQSCGKRAEVFEVFVAPTGDQAPTFGRTGSPPTTWLCAQCLQKTGRSAISKPAPPSSSRRRKRR